MEALCRYWRLYYCSQGLLLNYPLFHSICGQPMCMKVQPLHEIWYNLLMVLAIATMVIGNLFAIRQQNIKRFLAFSSIAQVGFILVGISGNSNASVSSVVYFILIYTFS